MFNADRQFELRDIAHSMLQLAERCSYLELLDRLYSECQLLMHFIAAVKALTNGRHSINSSSDDSIRPINTHLHDRRRKIAQQDFKWIN
jgi:hypothetical protein